MPGIPKGHDTVPELGPAGRGHGQVDGGFIPQQIVNTKEVVRNTLHGVKAPHNTPESQKHLPEGTFQFRVSNSHIGRARKCHAWGNSHFPSYPERGNRLGQFGGSDLCTPSTAPPLYSGEKRLMGLMAGEWLRKSFVTGCP